MNFGFQEVRSEVPLVTRNTVQGTEGLIVHTHPKLLAERDMSTTEAPGLLLLPISHTPS